MFGAGCASGPRGVERSARTVESIQQVQTRMQKGLEQVDATITSLQAMSVAGGDLAASYKAFSNNLNLLDKMADDVASRNQAMRARATEYFAEWEKETAQMSSSKVKAISTERRAVARTSFDKMTAEMSKGKEAFTAMMDELRDIQLYLSNDLTPGGVKACKPLADQATAHAASVKKSLQIVNAELTRVRTELTPPAPAPAAK
jgi:hypothetical protein